MLEEIQKKGQEAAPCHDLEMFSKLFFGYSYFLFLRSSTRLF